MTYTPTIEAQIQDCIDRSEQGIERLREIQSRPRSTPPARPRSIGIPWAAVALGAGIGAAVVAIAAWGMG
jgi:hypothetical protein